jgi:hypothetical protein
MHRVKRTKFHMRLLRARGVEKYSRETTIGTRSAVKKVLSSSRTKIGWVAVAKPVRIGPASALMALGSGAELEAGSAIENQADEARRAQSLLCWEGKE